MEIPDARKFNADHEESKWYENEPASFNFGDLERPVANILDALREHIENGEYALVIGDDASGRLPTLLLSGVLKQIYRARGHADFSVQFFAGSRTGATETYIEHLTRRFAPQFARLQGWHLGRVLVVTDVISTGTTLGPLASLLKEYQIPFDVAAISMLDENVPDEAIFEKSTSEIFQLLDELYEQRRKNIEAALGGTVVLGGMHGLPSVYKNPHAAGVVRQSGKTVAVPAVGGIYPRLERDELTGRPVLQEHVHAARENIASLVQTLSVEYLRSQ